MWDGKKYDEFQSEYQYNSGCYLIEKIESITDLTNKYIIDLGCGNGSLTYLLSKKTKSKITGIDSDVSMLKSLREKYYNTTIEIEHNDILTWLSISKSSCDIIFSNAVLHWLGSHENLLKLIKLCKNIIRPQGLLAIRFSLKNNALEIKKYLEDKLELFLGHKESPYLQQSQLDFDIFCEQLESNKYKIIYKEDINFIPFRDDNLVLKFMLHSQPIRQYFDDQSYKEFEKYLNSEWTKNSVQLKSHHGIFIAES
jgi:trans-aconitate methyltransferase